jgi:IS5 family transposase
VPQASIFDSYSEHEFGKQLSALSRILDDHASIILPLIEGDLLSQSTHHVGRCGVSVETVFRCLLLKQMLQISYDDLAFHLSDSMSYRTFARIPGGTSPKRSSLQASIRQIKADTLEEVFQALSSAYFDSGIISLEKIRIDSTVVKSNIATPSDSQLLNDGVRVLSRLLSKSRETTGVKIRFTDKRKESKSLSYQIFNAKKAEKDALYPQLLRLVEVVLKQVERALQRVKSEGNDKASQNNWIDQVKHYRDLLLRVVDQTKRRVIDGENVLAHEDGKGFITYLSIEKGNPNDADRFIPVIDGHLSTFGQTPSSTVSDGCYASLDNIDKGKALGLTRVVFHKRRGLSYRDMGVKKKTFKRLKDFRAGVEGNISELKRAFGLCKAIWKGVDGFKAFVWSSVISYNLIRLARAESG